MMNMDMQISSGFGETYDFGILSEAFSAQDEVVFADEANLALASSAFSTIFSVFS